MKTPNQNQFALAALLLFAVSSAYGQTNVTLEDTSQTTTLSANVSEQAQVTVPATVTFPVTDITVATAAPGATVTIDNIVLATATKTFKISVQANAAAFTPSVGGATTWDAADVSWAAGTWTTAAGAPGTLSSAAYNEVATCTADTASCSTTGLVFTLGAKSTVKRSGSHTLVMTWKFEAFGA